MGLGHSLVEFQENPCLQSEGKDDLKSACCAEACRHVSGVFSNL